MSTAEITSYYDFSASNRRTDRVQKNCPLLRIIQRLDSKEGHLRSMFPLLLLNKQKTHAHFAKKHSPTVSVSEISKTVVSRLSNFHSEAKPVCELSKIRTHSQNLQIRIMITDHLLKRLNIAKQASSVSINGNGDSNTKTQHRVNICIRELMGMHTPEVLVLPRIIAPQPSQFINIDE